MLSNESKKRFIEQFKAIGTQIRSLETDHREEARTLYEQLDLTGAIKAISPLENQARKILDLAAQQTSSFGPIFGVDGGSTRPKPLENGTMLCAVQAVMTGSVEYKLNGLPLDAYRSLSLVTHSFRLDLGSASSERFDDDPYAYLWRIHISRTYLQQDIERVISGLARLSSESAHTLRMANELDLNEAFFYLDGNLFPIGLYYYFAKGSGESSFDSEFSWTEWDQAIEVLALPLRVTEMFHEKGWPFVGVNKNPGTSWLLEFTLPEASQNWASDAQFIKAVLSQTANDELGYTGWFVQERYSLPQQRDAGAIATFDLFDRLKSFHLVLSPDSYHTCFFYVYDPRVKSIIKIEVPRVVLNQHDPLKLREAVLCEIASGKGVPNAIRRADSRARITHEESLRLLTECGVEPDYHYDHSRGELL